MMTILNDFILPAWIIDCHVRVWHTGVWLFTVLVDVGVPLKRSRWLHTMLKYLISPYSSVAENSYIYSFLYLNFFWITKQEGSKDEASHLALRRHFKRTRLPRIGGEASPTLCFGFFPPVECGQKLFISWACLRHKWDTYVELSAQKSSRMSVVVG